MSGEAAERALPPYVSYRTWSTFLARLREHLPLPPTLDTTFWLRLPMSGTNKSALRGALVFLGLMAPGRHPVDNLERLAKADGEERKRLLEEVVSSAYGDLLAKVDLKRATVGALRDYFKEVGARGEVGEKCARFFVAVARDAGLVLHQSLTTRIYPRRKTWPKLRTQRPVQRDDLDYGVVQPGRPALAQIPPLLKLLLEQLPDSGPWEGKQSWKKAWDANFDMLYPDSNGR